MPSRAEDNARAMEAGEHESRVVNSLYRISSLVSNTDDPRRALEIVLDEIVFALNPASASIALVNPDTQRLELEVSRDLPDPSGADNLALGRGITGWTAMHGRSLVVPDVREEPRYVSARENIYSEMAVPMEERGAVIGVVNVDSETPGAFGEDSLKVLTLLTNEASRVVSRLWLIRQLRTKANQLESLVNTGQRLVSKLELDDLLEGVAREARQLMQSDVCALFLLNPDGASLRLHSMIGPEGPMGYDEDLSIDDSSVGAAIQHRKQVEVNDLLFTEEHHFVRVIREEGLVSMLSSPIVFDDDVIGVLNVYTKRPHRFNNDERKVFATLASLGAVAIQNVRLYARIFATEESLRRNEQLTTLGMLSAEIAHEIRNPLTVIKLLFDSLHLDFGDDPRQGDVAMIREKLGHLEAIVTRVLRFGRSREELQARYDLNELVDETLRLVRLKLRQQKIAIDRDVQSDAIMVHVNKGQIEQVLLNLVLNATQAMDEGGAIRIETRARNDGFADVFIRDNGPGMAEATRSELFESFLSQRPDGTGLGLSISKRILRAHRGDIELVESTAQGTTFRFWLPRADSP